LGPDNAPDLVESLELLYAGALVRAGMGYASYTQIADRLETLARLLLDERPSRVAAPVLPQAGTP